MGILNAVSQATRLVAYNTLRMSQELLLVSSCMRSQWDALFSYRTVLEIVWHHFFSFFIGERWLFFFPQHYLSMQCHIKTGNQTALISFVCLKMNTAACSLAYSPLFLLQALWQMSPWQLHHMKCSSKLKCASFVNMFKWKHSPRLALTLKDLT